MDNPGLINDEVIADSEDEMDQGGLQLDRNSGVVGHGIDITSSVSMFTTVGYPQVNPFSAISTFTGDTPRLRVQPARISSFEHEDGNFNEGRNNQTDTSISSVNGTFTDLEGISGPGNIADRAKMRQRTQKKPLVDVSDIIELTSDDDDDELSLKPSTSKTRPTTKVKSKPKAKPKAKEISSEDPVTSVTSNTNTVSSVPPKPRPRPVPIKKRPKPPQDAAASASTSGPELPVATSPPRMPQLYHNSTYQLNSQLPPSDPLNSTFRTDYNRQNEAGLPHIEALPNFGPGGPLSSPSSLFSDPGTTAKKWNRRPQDTDAEVDELATSEGGPNSRYHSEHSISPGKMPPPPTFFAGSSPPSMGGGKGIPPDPGPQHVVDLTMLPPTMPPNTNLKSAPKPKKPKKKVDEKYNDDEVPLPMIILDEDEQDEDFDPTGDGEKKKKGKAKSKEKTTKNKAKVKDTKTSPGTAQVEVFITTKPPKVKTKAKEKSDAKNKGKAKEVVKEGHKEIFKSREYIEDSDEDDPMRLVGGPSVAYIPVTPSAITSKEKTTISSSTESAIAASAVPSPSTLSKTAAPASTPLFDSEMAKPKSSTSKNPSDGKKRKTIIDSDDEEEEAPQIQVNAAPSVSKKRKTDSVEKKKEKTKAKAKGKTKQIVLSDEEEDLPVLDKEDSVVQVEDKVTKKGKSSKKMILDEEDDNDGGDLQVGAPQHNLTPEEVPKSTKENAVPPVSKPTMTATPKPSRPISLNQDGSTPLYARYEIAPRRSSLPMSELIRRANTMPGSPFSTPHPSSASASKLRPLTARTPSSTAYSPYLKSSRSLLSKIAPLHPNRRTPPPPPPPPPPRKKSKKELEMEEKWEEEMVEDAGGMEAWAALQDEERKEIRKIKWAREMGGWDD